MLIERLAMDLNTQFKRGFTKSNLWNMRTFYLAWPQENILQTVSRELNHTQECSKNQIQDNDLTLLANHFRLPWSAYVRLLSVKDASSRSFYETEALKAGWSVRQISSLFYERTALSNNKVANNGITNEHALLKTLLIFSLINK
jgi:hypothetical protein